MAKLRYTAHSLGISQIDSDTVISKFLHCLRRRATTSVVLMAFTAADAGPAVAPGDSVLKHDIQVLSDYGIIKGPVTTWPLSWGPIVEDMREFDGGDSVPPLVSASFSRLRERAEWETRTHHLRFSTSAGIAEEPARIRSFESTPRERAEIGGGIAWTGDRVTVKLAGQLVYSDNNEVEARADGSTIGLLFGNYSISVNTLDRWWGPGADGSLVLSNNARPVPAISLDRNFTDASGSRWLSWLGPWDLNITAGQLETNRYVSDAQFLGMRFNFRPLPGLELGLSRTAQWCGQGRPCNAEAFLNLALGNDNRGDGGVERDEEPGNQLAGLDFRWSRYIGGMATAVYGQFIGEDEAGGFPSGFLGQLGIETSGIWDRNWSWRLFSEIADTTCRFYKTDKQYNCAYNHSIYRSGYRYKGRPIGHGIDNDARIVSTGLLLVNSDHHEWQVLLRHGDLNRGGPVDIRNTVTPVPADLLSLDIGYSRGFRYGTVDAGIGIKKIDTSDSDHGSDARVYLQWRSGY